MGRHRTVDVRLVGVPLALFQASAEQHDDLLREFALIESGGAAPDHIIYRLQSLMSDLEGRFGDAAAVPAEQLKAAASSGAATVDVAYALSPDAGRAAAELLQLLEQVDAFCRDSDELLTMATRPEVQVFRRWFLGEFFRQVDGATPTPWSQWHGSQWQADHGSMASAAPPA